MAAGDETRAKIIETPKLTVTGRSATAGPNAFARLGLGLVVALAYFVAPMLLIATFALGVLFWSVAAYVFGYVLGIGFALAVPLWLAAHGIQRREDRGWCGAILFLLAGAFPALLAFGHLALVDSGEFAPLSSLGADGATGVILLIGYAGICSSLGWLTVRVGTKESPYADALGGLDITQLVELARNANK